MLELKNITKIYKGTGYETLALDNVNLTIEDGDFVAVMGTSGSGKSTLLNIIGCMDRATDGTYLMDGQNVCELSIGKLNALRKEKVSFVFQYFALMKEYTVYENVEMPLLARNVSRGKRKQLVNEALKSLGIEEIKNKKPSNISGGQQQRAAIARALVTNSKLILADEPTGALDRKTGRELMELLKKINDTGKTIIMVTHDENVAAYAKRVVRIEDGKLIP